MANSWLLTPDMTRALATRYHTPLYVFFESTVRARCAELRAALSYPHSVIRYACKALTLRAILQIVREEGLWIDASSLNEAKRALLAGYSPNTIQFTGESSSQAVFTELMELGVGINCSSLDQMRLIGELFPGARVSFRLNPGEGHGANNKVNTGGPASKHGIYIDQLDDVRRITREYDLRIHGVHAHIGSGTDLEHWLRIKDITLSVAKKFDEISFVNLGGGLPVVYNPATELPMPLTQWGDRLSESMLKYCQECGRDIRLEIEPGRFVVAESGFLISEIQNIKRTPSYQFAILNTGFNHNPRPAMYGSYHPIEIVSGDSRDLRGSEEYVIGGYLCESGDLFTRSETGELLPRLFPKLQVRDLAIMGLVGAYSHPMKSDYNSMNLPASILIDTSGAARVIERRGTLEDIIRREIEVF